jgi:hypothetical protein
VEQNASGDSSLRRKGSPLYRFCKITGQQTADSQQTPRIGAGRKGMIGECRSMRVGPTTVAKIEQCLPSGLATRLVGLTKQL